MTLLLGPGGISPCQYPPLLPDRHTLAEVGVNEKSTTRLLEPCHGFLELESDP